MNNMLCLEGRVALASFTSFAVLSLFQVRILVEGYWSYKYCLLVFFAAVLCTLVLPLSDVVKRAALLGTVFGGSLVLCYLLGTPWRTLAVYGMSLSFFHFSEYLLTAVYNKHLLSVSSFLLNHSLEYKLAALFSVVEFVAEALLLPSLKSITIFNLIGLTMVVLGEILRKVAMATAKSNFTHAVQFEKKEEHVLVTCGVYGWSRHPSYVGWFYWSIGTQVLLCNPLCFVAYIYASWNFFNERIREEEYHLFQFFGDEYIEYVLAVPTRLPFIKGIEEELKIFKKAS